jgi:deoxyhypusine synthase
LVKHRFVSAIVTTAGGIEEDIIKCLGTTHLGEFHLDGSDLRTRGLNRIGNLLVPNDNYCKFEDWVMPKLEKMREEQGDDLSKAWSPSKVCERLGQEINDESSFLYWAAKVSGIAVRSKTDYRVTWMLNICLSFFLSFFLSFHLSNQL